MITIFQIVYNIYKKKILGFLDLNLIFKLFAFLSWVKNLISKKLHGSIKKVHIGMWLAANSIICLLSQGIIIIDIMIKIIPMYITSIREEFHIHLSLSPSFGKEVF